MALDRLTAARQVVRDARLAFRPDELTTAEAFVVTEESSR